MKIAIDHHLVTRNPKSGMGVYVSEITKGLSRSHKTTLLDFKIKKSSSVVGKIAGLFGEQIWVQFQLPNIIAKSNAEVVYFPNPPLTIVTSKPILLTIPDMSFYNDDSMNFLVKCYLYFVYILSAHRAGQITTFSKNSKKDICDILHISENKVSVTPLAVKSIFEKRTKTKKSKLLAGYTSKKVILTVPGSFIPRKNMLSLLEAYNLLPNKVKDKTIIVAVGGVNDKYYLDFKKSVDGMGLTNKVIFTGHISDEELKKLYQQAFMFVFPSLYEGFGLPPLEAMGQGIPVIVYNRSSLPEVVGDAAILVNNHKELCKAIEKLHRNPSFRKSLIKKGMKQVKKFNWEKTVSEINSALEAVSI